MTTLSQRTARRAVWHKAHPVVKDPAQMRRPIDRPTTAARLAEKHTSPSILARQGLGGKLGEHHRQNQCYPKDLSDHLLLSFGETWV
jgi:hypothetical protein